MRQGKENRGGPRKGAGRPPGPQPHLQGDDPRSNRIKVSVTDRELAKLVRARDRRGVPVAQYLYELAKDGGL